MVVDENYSVREKKPVFPKGEARTHCSERLKFEGSACDLIH